MSIAENISKIKAQIREAAIAAGREYANYRMNQCIAVSMSGASLFGECKTILVFACLAYLSAMAWGLSKKFPRA